jgi:hypothetical protein
VFFVNDIPSASAPLTCTPQSLNVKARRFVFMDNPSAMAHIAPLVEEGYGLEMYPRGFLLMLTFKSRLLLDNNVFNDSPQS